MKFPWAKWEGSINKLACLLSAVLFSLPLSHARGEMTQMRKTSGLLCLHPSQGLLWGLGPGLILSIFQTLLKWVAQLGFPFILLYYFQIKLSLMSCSRTMKARLQGIRVTSHSVIQNSQPPHLGQGVVDNPWKEVEVWWWQRSKKGDPHGHFSSVFQNEVKIPWAPTPQIHSRCTFYVSYCPLWHLMHQILCKKQWNIQHIKMQRIVRKRESKSEKE